MGSQECRSLPVRIGASGKKALDDQDLCGLTRNNRPCTTGPGPKQALPRRPAPKPTSSANCFWWPALSQRPTGLHHMTQAWEEGPGCGRSCWPGTKSAGLASQENQLRGKQANSSGSLCCGLDSWFFAATHSCGAFIMPSNQPVCVRPGPPHQC